MKITRIETFDTKYVGFVRITAEDGSIGWGQVSTYNSDLTCQVLHRQVARWVLNRDTRDLDDLLDFVTEREHKFPGSYLRRAMAGFDTAVWDLRGRQAGKSVAELLGGTPGPIRAYASSMKRDITPADEAERMKRLRDQHGFDAFKVRAGAEVGRNRDEWPGRTEEIITTMHREMGDTATLLIDANSCYSPDRAIKIGRMLEQNGFSHFEEPCPYWDLEQTKQVTDTLDIDVTGGEQDCDLTIWKRMIDMRAVTSCSLIFSILAGSRGPCASPAWRRPRSCRLLRIVRTCRWSRCSRCTFCGQFPTPESTWSFRSRGPITIPGRAGCLQQTPTALTTGKPS